MRTHFWDEQPPKRPFDYVWDDDAARRIADTLRTIWLGRRSCNPPPGPDVGRGEESYAIIATGQTWHTLLDAANLLETFEHSRRNTGDRLQRMARSQARAAAAMDIVQRVERLEGAAKRPWWRFW